MYKVVIFNDDYTTMDFVVMVLQRVFNKQAKEAEELMLAVHNTGQAVVGVYTYDVARTKVEIATTMAQENGYPLRLTFQPE